MQLVFDSSKFGFHAKKERKKGRGISEKPGPRRTQTMMMVQILCQRQGQACVNRFGRNLELLGWRGKTGLPDSREEPEL